MSITQCNAHSFLTASLTKPDHMQRAQRIQRNAALIEQLQLKRLVSDLATSIRSKAQKKPRKLTLPRHNAGKTKCQGVAEPARRSARHKSRSCEDTDQQSQIKKQIVKDLEGTLFFCLFLLLFQQPSNLACDRFHHDI